MTTPSLFSVGQRFYQRARPFLPGVALFLFCAAGAWAQNGSVNFSSFNNFMQSIATTFKSVAIYCLVFAGIAGCVFLGFQRTRIAGITMLALAMAGGIFMAIAINHVNQNTGGNVTF